MIPTPLLLKAAPYAIAALVGGGWYAANNAHQRTIGAQRVLLAQDRLTIAALEDSARRQEVRYRVDTVRLRQVVSRWDTLTRAYHDTTSVVVHDTTPVPVVQVREIVRAGDSAQAACGVVVASCEQRLTIAAQEVATMRNQVTLTKGAVPSAWRVWSGRALWGGAGVGLGWLIWHRR